MIVYVVFRRDYQHKKGELMGMLIERRRDLRGKTRLESGLKWAKFAFGHLVEDKKDIFVIPKELEVEEDAKSLLYKGVFTKEEFLEVMEVVNRKVKIKKKREKNFLA